MVKLLQPEKEPIEVTPSGIVIEVKLLQPSKAELPIEVTPSGIVIVVNLLQFSKAYGFIPVVPFLIVTLVKESLGTEGARAIFFPVSSFT